MHLAIDIGATKTLVGVFDHKGRLTATVKNRTLRSQADFEKWLFATCDLLLDGKSPKNIGTAVPGIVATNGSFTTLNLGWSDYNLKRLIEAKYSTPVIIGNDTKFAGISEARSGAGAGHQNVLFVSISTGVGTAILLDGAIPNGMQMSEASLMLSSVRADSSKSPDSVEQLISGSGFKRRFGQDAETAQDPAIWRAYADTLADCLFNMSVMFFPEVIVLGGGLANQYPRFKQPLEHAFKELFLAQCPVPLIRRARYVNDGVLYGLYECRDEPSQRSKEDIASDKS